MRVAEMHYTDVSSGALEVNDFSVEVDAVLMRQMISQIAKNKIEYPVREVCSNAWDTHAPFTVELPTMWTPIFRVRDEGPGLSHDEIMTVYTRIGKSLKRDTDEKVGSKGWGSKSPFAYLTSTGSGSAAFNVVSKHDGVARHYIMALAESGMPQARFMFEEPTSDTGLEVSFPVRKDDIWKFEDAAKKILWFFPPRPTITPSSFELKAEAETITKTGDGWTLHNNNAPIHGPHVRMGCVGYPIDFDLIGLGDWPWMNENIVFEAPVGSVELQTSREALSYDDKTKQTLCDLIANFEFEFVEQVRQAIDDQPTYWAACAKLHELGQTFGHKQVNYVARKIQYRGRLAPTTQHEISLTNTKFMRFRVSDIGAPTFQAFRYSVDDRRLRGYGSSHATLNAEEMQDVTVIVEMKPNRSQAKINQLNLAPGTTVLWLRPNTITARDLILDQFDLSLGEVIDLDKMKVDYTVTPRGAIDKTLTKVKILSHGKVVDAKIDLNEPGVYIYDRDGGSRRRSRSYDVSRSGANMGLNSLHYQIEQLIKHKLLDPETVVLVADYKTYLPPGWQKIGDAVTTKIDARINWRQVRRLVATGADIDQHLRKITSKEHLPHFDLTKMPADLADLIQRVVKYKESKSKIVIPKETQALWDLRQKFASTPAPVDKNAEQQIVNGFHTEIESLFKRLPIFKNLLDNLSYYYGTAGRDQLAHYLNLELIASQKDA